MIIDVNDRLVSSVRVNDSKRIEFGENNSKVVSISPIGIKLDMDIEEGNLKQAVERSNQKFMSDNRRLEYSYHKEAKRYVIKVIDSSTNEMIRQIPSQKVLDYIEGLMEYIGLNVDQKI
jgi:flagellar protein FlaG